MYRLFHEEPSKGTQSAGIDRTPGNCNNAAQRENDDVSRGKLVAFSIDNTSDSVPNDPNGAGTSDYAKLSEISTKTVLSKRRFNVAVDICI
jgi:hypothetical protein